MKTTLFVPVVAALAAIFTAASLTTADGATYDFNAAWGDGSATSNPNGPWSLRYGDELLANHYWSASEAAWIWDSDGSTVPSFNFTHQYKWNDCQPGDIIMQGTFGGQPGNIRWTAPSDGVIDISGRTWDAYGSRAGSWTLSVGASQVAAGTIAGNSARTSAGVTFAENLLPGKSLTSIPVVAGTTVELTQYSATAGVNFTVTYQTIANVRAAQRPGTKLVDIDYDLTNTTNPVYVTLEISADGGTTWAVPATTLTGAVGANVMPGSNLRITWDAGVDWDNQVSSQMQFRLKGIETLLEQADFALIPGGTFTMGDTLDGSPGAPPHQVNVSTFYMQKTEMTKAEWDTVREWGMLHGYTDLGNGVGTAADHPVQHVSWYDVVKWCNAKSEMDGLNPCYYTDAAQTTVFRVGTNDIDNTMVKWSANGFRMPTEAEWEKAARGGLSGKRYPLGNSITTADANYSAGGTVAVGSYAPSGYGLYDMAGNAWEWCWDWYSGSYFGTPESLTDPAGPTGSNRLVRSGNWYGAEYCTVAYRNYTYPANVSYPVGFRMVRTVRTNQVNAESQIITVITSNPILTITALHGTVLGAGQHPLNALVELTATPDLGYLFSKWTGDATGTANPLTVTMDSDKTITAVFANDTRDPDGDGLTNYQELVQYAQFHCDPNNRDTDGDGFWDGVEINRGTNPSDPASRPDMAMAIRTAVEVSIETALGQHYQIESSIDLLTWTPAGDGISDDGTGHIVHGGHIVGTGATITLWYSTKDLPQRHFRAVRIPPP